MVKNIFVCFLIIVTMGGAGMSVKAAESSSKQRLVLLIGASVGNAWNLPEWPKRSNVPGYGTEMVAVYTFDKSHALQEALIRPQKKFSFSKKYILGLFAPAQRKPDVIIIKECAAYFPGDMVKYQSSVKKWVADIKQANIVPVLATVVPVTQEHAGKRPGRLEGILAFNDWVLSYSSENKLLCLDLEKALVDSNGNRSLRPELTSGDGLHLNKKAYDILDGVLAEFLQNNFRD
jgi:hypothetical protein